MRSQSRRIVTFCVLSTIVALVHCSKAPSTTSPSLTGNSPTGAHGTGERVGVLVGAGDIGFCGPSTVSGSEATGRLVDRLGGTVFTTGDNAYPSGSAEDYERCYTPGWGRHLGRTRPAPGNHEY